jgi:hypothetical protein
MAPHYHPGNHLHQICPYQSGTQKKNLISNTHHINPNQYFLHKESLVKNMLVLPKWIVCDDNGARLLLLLPIG